MTMLFIRVGTLIDGRGGRPIRGAVVEVDGERITRVMPAGEGAPAAGATVWDFSSYTMLPGLIDAHVHLRGSGEPREMGWGVSEAAELPGTTALNCFINARKNLEFG